jgi:hypothetical protein
MMKSIPKITRVQLKVEHEEGSILLGLVSSEPDYKLSLALNKRLGISLKNISPVKILSESGTEVVFSRFSDSTGSPELIYNLFSNRSGKYFLLKKLKNVDYIFYVYDSENNNTIESVTTILREIASVNAVFNIDLATFKDKNLHFLNH